MNCRSLNSIVLIFLVCACSCVHANTGTFIGKHNATDLRVVSYNVFWNSIFDQSSEDPEKFERIVNALQPDILNLQEVTVPVSGVINLMNSIYPLPGGSSWHGFSRSDNVILSKYPLLQQSPIARGGASALIDLPDATYSKDFLVLNDHWACCNNEPTRQTEADSTIEDLKIIRSGVATFSVPEDTPFVVLGDLNIVRSGAPLETVLSGDISDNDTYGPDSPPDWDGTSITDANPVHNGTGIEDWTWRDDAQIFDPGILDFILYSDSVLSTANNFVLNTTTMTGADLLATGLQENDVVLRELSGTYDHIPVVVDFTNNFTTPPLDGDFNNDGYINAADYTIWRDKLGRTGSDIYGDGNRDGIVDALDYQLWANTYQLTNQLPVATSVSVPEPSSFVAVVIFALGGLLNCRCQ